MLPGIMVLKQVVINNIEQAAAYADNRNGVDEMADTAHPLPWSIEFVGAGGSEIVTYGWKKRGTEWKCYKQLAQMAR